MKLVYFWVDKIHDIEVNQGINLGSEWIYWVEENPVKADEKILRRKTNEDYVQGFWGERISNVTALIGENGSGKTTILENDFRAVGFGGDGEMIFEDNRQIYSNWKIEKDFDCHTLPSDLKIDWIFYSPIYSFHIPEFHLYFPNDNSGPLNISSNFLIQVENGIMDTSVNSRLNLLEFHRSAEINRQLSFAKSFQNESLPLGFNLPTSITLGFIGNEKLEEGEKWKAELDTYPRALRQWYHKLIEDTKSPFSWDLNKIAEDEYEKDSPEEILNYKRWRTYIKFLRQCLIYLFYNGNGGPQLPEYIEDKFVFLGVKESKQVAHSTIIPDFSKLDSRSKSEMTFLSLISLQEFFRGDLIVDFVLQMKKLIFENIIELDESSGSFKLELNLDQAFDLTVNYYQPLLNNFVFRPFKMKTEMLQFGWRNLSAGELSKLNLFSRLFYSQRLRLERAEKLKVVPSSTLLLLVDEGEYGFHLKWQKDYIKDLLEIVPKLFSNPSGPQPQIQIVLATHSPVSLSDIPAAHVVLLESETKGVEKKIRISDGRQLRTNTFGANIHDLFKEGFFMGDGFMGKFAEEKIKAIIEQLNETLKMGVIQEASALEKQINLIGEPVLKQKLLELLDYRIHGQMDEEKLIGQQIKDLEERRDRIRKGKKTEQ